MAKYAVVVSWDVTVNAPLEVDATSPEAAKQKVVALLQAEDEATLQELGVAAHENSCDFGSELFQPEGLTGIREIENGELLEEEDE